MCLHLRSVVVLLAMGWLVGCAGSAEPTITSGSDSEVRSALRAFAPVDGDSLTSEEQVESLRYAAERLQRYGWQPATGRSFLRPHLDATLADSGRAHVVGLLPGRDARVREDLVVIAADLDSESAAAVLGVAQRLAQRAVYENVPGRTVLVGFWGAPRTGIRGFADITALPGWLPERVTHVVYATADTTDAAVIRATLSPFSHARVHFVQPPESGREGTSVLARMRRAREVAAVVRWADVLTEAVVASAMATSAAK